MPAGSAAEAPAGQGAPQPPPQMEALVKALGENAGPTVVFAYGEEDRIRLSSSSPRNPLGLIDMLLLKGGNLGPLSAAAHGAGGERSTADRRRCDGLATAGGRGVPNPDSRHLGSPATYPRRPFDDTWTPALDIRPVIALDGFGVKLGKRWVLQELTAELKGRSIGLLGPNGAGKTTLINTLLGFHTHRRRPRPHARPRRRRQSASCSRRRSATCRSATPSSPA